MKLILLLSALSLSTISLAHEQDSLMNKIANRLCSERLFSRLSLGQDSAGKLAELIKACKIEVKKSELNEKSKVSKSDSHWPAIQF